MDELAYIVRINSPTEVPDSLTWESITVRHIVHERAMWLPSEWGKWIWPLRLWSAPSASES